MESVPRVESLRPYAQTPPATRKNEGAAGIQKGKARLESVGSVVYFLIRLPPQITLFFPLNCSDSFPSLVADATKT